MMKVKLLVSRVGADFSQSAGEEIEVSSKDGARMIEAGQAVPVATKPQRATKKPRETRG